MKAELVLRNIGGITGEENYVLRSGVLNVVESPNAAGKSTLIKGIAAGLSLPCKRPLTREVAHRMGIKNMKPGLREPLVNISADSATLLIKEGDKDIKLEIRTEGNVRIYPEGDDTLLLTSILTRESEVVRRLIDGESNFEWIVDNASLAEQYMNAGSVVEKWLATAQLQLEEIDQKASRIEELKDEEKGLVETQLELKKKIDDLERELQRLPKKDPKLDERWNELRLEKAKATQNRDQMQSKIEFLKKEAAPKEQQIKIAEKTIQKIESRLADIQNKISVLPTKDEIKAWQDNIEKIETLEKPGLDKKRYELEGQIKLFDNALTLTSETRATTCFLCLEGTLTPEKIKDRRGEIQNNKREIEKQISKLVSRRNELFARLNKTSRDEKTLNDELTFIKSSYGQEQSNLEKLRTDIKSDKVEIEQKETELQTVLSRIKDFNGELGLIEKRLATFGKRQNELIEDLGKHRNELESLREKIASTKESIIERSTSYLEEVPISIDVAREFLTNWIADLQEAFDYLVEKAESQKRLACRQFNKNIKYLLKELRFTGFEDIWINEETYNLSALRKTEGGGVPQPISSLSTSEKHVIATIMQIAMKGAYSSGSPFFIIDEVILDFDNRRASAIIGYLKEIAKQNDWYVILARLGGEGDLRIKYMD